jgi:hypothetical protein
MCYLDVSQALLDEARALGESRMGFNAANDSSSKNFTLCKFESGLLLPISCPTLS